MNRRFLPLDGWTSTTRSIRWSPLFVAPVATSVALLAGDALVDVAALPISLVGETGLALAAAVAAFIADDATREAAPATPVAARARLAVRAALMLPVVIAGWLLVLALYARVLPPSIDLGHRALAGLGVASGALALAAVGSRFWSIASPGAAGLAAMATLGLVLQLVPDRWMAHAPAGTVLWPVTILASLLVVAHATQEPPGV